MAEDTDPESKTEDPTSKRLGDARAKGDVAKSPDLPQWASLAAVTAVLLISGGTMAQNLMTGLTPFIAHPDEFVLQNNGALQVARLALNAGLPIVMTVLATAALAGAAGHIIQTGFVWAPDKIKPDLSKMSPLGGLKRMFGLDGMVNFGKSLIKATVVVMNPTHFAVALRYDDETPAPLCVAKGVDSLALKIRQIAEEAGVPVVEDPPLARALYAAVEIDQTIPRQHYEAVAKVIGFVMSAARRRRAKPLR